MTELDVAHYTIGFYFFTVMCLAFIAIGIAKLGEKLDKILDIVKDASRTDRYRKSVFGPSAPDI